MVLIGASLIACGGLRRPVQSAIDARDLHGASAAYERFRHADGADDELLASIAELALEEAAMGEDELLARTAVMQLRSAGNAGLPALGHIADAEGVTEARALALAHLVRRGRESYRGYLFSLLESSDPKIAAAAVISLRAEEDQERLVALLEQGPTEVREAAARRLESGDESLLPALTERARNDPSPRVRSAAVRALAAIGEGAASVLVDRMSDEDGTVRAAAIRALFTASLEQATTQTQRLVSVPTCREGVEAARLAILRSMTPRAGDDSGVLVTEELAARAREYLHSALRSPDPIDRSQAAVALVSLPESDDSSAALAASLERETNPVVRLGLARALRRSSLDELANATLRELVTDDNANRSPMASLQAALLLSANDEEAALSHMEAVLAGENTFLRRIAARGLAKDAARPDEARPFLQDEDPMVRIYTAGGILSGLNERL